MKLLPSRRSGPRALIASQLPDARALIPSRLPDASALVPSRSRLGPVAGQIAQDGALAALIGGNLFGRVAMHPALGDVSDASERGKVLNRAWRRYGTVNSLALVSLVSGWLSARSDESAPLWTSPRRRSLVLAKDIAVGAVLTTGLASAAGGIGFAHQAADGAVPMADGTETAPSTPPRARSLKHLVNVLGGLNLASELSLLGVNVLLSRSASRRLVAR
jgi:hypothetical protein